eukprot:363362-Chlamydomonas_euryale.AAC.21
MFLAVGRQQRWITWCRLPTSTLRGCGRSYGYTRGQDGKERARRVGVQGCEPRGEGGWSTGE